MFQQHTSIYTTFHPADRVKAIRVIAEFTAAHPGRAFVGRHQTSDVARLADALACSSLTLILESGRTCMSREVQRDVEASLAKIPPNQILRILLPSTEAMPDDSILSKTLIDIGVEMVSSEGAAVADALDRLDLLGRYEPKLRQSATKKVKFRGGCVR